MNPFLNLDVELDLSKFELRDLIEGRAALLAELDKLGGENWEHVAPENEQRFAGLADRLEKVVGPEVEKREAAAKRRERRSRLIPGQTTTATPEGRSIPTPAAPPVREERDILDPESLASYSLLRGLRCMMNDREIDGLEGEVQQELEKRRGEAAKGLLIPWNLPETHNRTRARFFRERRDAKSTDWSGAIPTILSATLIDVLRNRMVLAAMGATVLTDLVGTFAIPKKTATSAHYWVAEAAAPTASVPTMGQVAFSPETIGTYVDYTRRLVNQVSVDVEQLVRDDIMAAIAIGIDLAGINGSGSSNQPEGILQNSSVPTVAIGTNGGALTWGAVVDLETEVADDNADIGSLGYVFSPKGRGHAKQTVAFASTARTIWAPDNTVNGYQAMASKQLPDNLSNGTGTNLSAAIFGNFADAVVGFWGGIDMILDSSSLSTSGGTRLVGLADVDFQLRRAESFAKIVDIDSDA